MNFEKALKATRRGIFVHGDKYRTAIIANRPVTRSAAFIDAFAMLEGSSLKIESVNRATQTIHTERGGIIRFFALADYMDCLAIRGMFYPNIIVIGVESDYPSEVQEVIRSVNRSRDTEITPIATWVESI